MKRRPIIFIVAISAVLFSAAGKPTAQARRTTVAQPNLESLPKLPVDTVSTPDPETNIILFSNNTWEYYRPSLNRFDELQVYTQYWDTSQVFSYKSVQLADLPAVVDLKLISSMSEFHYPLRGKVFSKYGRRGRRNHNGVDIPLKTGEPIYAAFDGKIRYSRFNSGGYGYLVIVRHSNGLETWYAHLSRLNVGVDDYVKAGQVIGFGGSTGRSRGPHLHFEMRYFDQTFDPEHLVDFESGNLRYQTFALEKTFFNINSRASDQIEDHDDFDDYAFAAGPDGEDLTSEDIIARINDAQSNPSATINQSNAVYHTIKSGDILGRLAANYGVSIDQICRLNNITRTTTLRIGRTLRVK